MPRGVAAAAALAALAWPGPAAAAEAGGEHPKVELENLEEDLPLEVTDAFPIAAGLVELQGLARYDHADDDPEGDDLILLNARLRVGLTPALEVGLAVPYLAGNAAPAERGLVALDALYNFHRGDGPLPALAVKGIVGVPYGERGEGVETELEFLATKPFGPERVGRRLHLNLVWAHKFDPGAGERGDRYAAAVGYSRLLTPDLLLVADVVREQELEEEHEATLAGAGLRLRLGPFLVLAAGAGVGLGDEAPTFRATVGLQYGLATFPTPW